MSPKKIPLLPPHLLLSLLSTPPSLYTKDLNFFQIPSMNISFSCPWDFTQSVFALPETATTPTPKIHILHPLVIFHI